MVAKRLLPRVLRETRSKDRAREIPTTRDVKPPLALKLFRSNWHAGLLLAAGYALDALVRFGL